VADPLSWLLETRFWVPRWHCGDWSLALGWCNILGDAGIALVYYVIPFLVWRLLCKRPELAPQMNVVRWAMLFVVACGTTHVLDAAMFWWPAYRLNCLSRAATALISAYDLFLLWYWRRHILAYASPAEYAKMYREKESALEKTEMMRQELLQDIDRRARQNKKLSDEMDALKDELVNKIHKVLTEADYENLKLRLVEIRRAAV
jgi:chemotaxis family two-component system sensor kinase Cph1